MPTTAHELPLELVRNRPQIASELLRSVFGIELPDHDRVDLTSESFAVFNPAELRSDTAVLLDANGEPCFGIVVESQTRYAAAKTYSWPVYLAALRHRKRCPVVLLVFCPDEETAAQCAQPIALGHPGWTLRPLVVYPERLPPVTDLARARELPELAIFNAHAHADGPNAPAVIAAFCAAIDQIETIDSDNARLYYDYVASRLSDAARKLLEESVKLDNYQWQSEFALSHIAQGRAEGLVEGEARGEAKGEAKSILLILDARGIPVSDDIRERITGCGDLETLEQWVRCATAVDTAEQLFD